MLESEERIQSQLDAYIRLIDILDAHYRADILKAVAEDDRPRACAITAHRKKDMEIIMLAFAQDAGKNDLSNYRAMRLGLTLALGGEPIQLQILEDWKVKRLN